MTGTLQVVENAMCETWVLIATQAAGLKEVVSHGNGAKNILAWRQKA